MDGCNALIGGMTAWLKVTENPLLFAVMAQLPLRFMLFVSPVKLVGVVSVPPVFFTQEPRPAGDNSRSTLTVILAPSLKFAAPRKPSPKTLNSA